MNRTDIAWFAGFFEGEGCVRLGSQFNRNGRAYGSPVIDICQVNKEPLDRCIKLFPHAHMYGPYQYKTNKQPHFKFTLLGRENVETVYNRIKEFLSLKRREQFELAFSSHDKLKDRAKLKTGPKTRRQNV